MLNRLLHFVLPSSFQSWCRWFAFFIALPLTTYANYILIPMDQEDQSDHLRAYGVAYWILNQQEKVDWLLNYRGGSFLAPSYSAIESRCKLQGVRYEIISDATAEKIIQEIQSPSQNMEVVALEKPPKIAVYSPKTKQPWDDAVTLVLTYADIPYDVIYDTEIFSDILADYDWLHLHHEDFTGQYGKFYAAYRNAPWYINQKKEFEDNATLHGHAKVSKAKLAIVQKIRAFVEGGGFLFAMCSATDTYDIALAAQKTDICQPMFDGDPVAPNAKSNIDYSLGIAFEDYTLVFDPMIYEYSSIDVTNKRKVKQHEDVFTLFDFSAKWDPVPTMLTQNHTKVVKGFMGQTTAFKKEVLKSNVLILGENRTANEAKYIHGKVGKGMFSFYGGHDPEDYQHRVGDPKTELALHPNSPGYRLILNNILFPAAKKKKQKT